MALTVDTKNESEFVNARNTRFGKAKESRSKARPGDYSMVRFFLISTVQLCALILYDFEAAITNFSKKFSKLIGSKYISLSYYES